MEFFNRVIEVRAPQTPLEGACKLLLLSQLITVPMTLSTTEPEQFRANSVIINGIHLLAVVIGFMWGAINQNRHEAPHLQR